MEETIIFRDELTSSINTDNILKALARANSKNLLDEINFNKYGKKDDVGLVPVSDIFSIVLFWKLRTNH